MARIGSLCLSIRWRMDPRSTSPERVDLPMAWHKIVSVAGTIFLATLGRGQQNPFLGRSEFPQYRQISGLSGGGYGVDLKGRGSLTGPTAFSTPLGVALGHDEVRLGGGDTGFSFQHLPDRFANTSRGSGKAFLTYGLSFRNVNFAYSYFLKSFRGDAATNLQASYYSGKKNTPSVSVGVQDIVGHGGSAGDGVAGDSDSSRSLFAAATMPILAVKGEPVYLTAGWGTRRFGKGFSSASYRLSQPLRLWAEYDGFGFNEGILVSYQTKGFKRRPFEANLLLGVIRGRYPTVALTIGF